MLTSRRLFLFSEYFIYKLFPVGHLASISNAICDADSFLQTQGHTLDLARLQKSRVQLTHWVLRLSYLMMSSQQGMKHYEWLYCYFVHVYASYRDWFIWVTRFYFANTGSISPASINLLCLLELYLSMLEGLDQNWAVFSLALIWDMWKFYLLKPQFLNKTLPAQIYLSYTFLHSLSALSYSGKLHEPFFSSASFKFLRH